MNHDPEALATALRADLQYLPYSDSQCDDQIFRFHDDRLRYELHIMPNNETVKLAADPEEPIQGCPMLEYDFQCTEIVIGTSAYHDKETAIRFYDRDLSPKGQRLTMTWVPHGFWYIGANANTVPYASSDG